jgi:hypothetical protein
MSSPGGVKGHRQEQALPEDYNTPVAEMETKKMKFEPHKPFVRFKIHFFIFSPGVSPGHCKNSATQILSVP